MAKEARKNAEKQFEHYEGLMERRIGYSASSASEIANAKVNAELAMAEAIDKDRKAERAGRKIIFGFIDTAEEAVAKEAKKNAEKRFEHYESLLGE